MSKVQPLRIDYDGKWKILIERTPKQFIEFLTSLSTWLTFRLLQVQVQTQVKVQN